MCVLKVCILYIGRPPSVDSMQLLEDCELGGLLDSLNTEVDLSAENPEESRPKGNRHNDSDFSGF